MAPADKTQSLVRVETADGDDGSSRQPPGSTRRRAGSTTPQSGDDGEQRQLDEFVDDGQCSAIAVTTSERCQRDALCGVEYCPIHMKQISDSKGDENGSRRF